MPDYNNSVPASTNDVRIFLNQEREKFIRDYGAVFEVVKEALAKIKTYKIYGRSDKQGGVALKDPRKVRFKFNSYFANLKQTSGSFWTVPDVIGFTIVVAYPSDITGICQVLDALVEGKQLLNAGAGAPRPSTARKDREDDEKRARELIETRFGRAILSGGYFACHYNVRTRGVGVQRPICEIQIKTVLHDAWGSKSHDLTYKPSGRTSRDLIDNFNLLGDTLAKIDQQSDIVRRSIERTARVREAKKRSVQESLITTAAKAAANGLQDLGGLVEEIVALDRAVSGERLSSIVDRLVDLFEAHKRGVCIALCLLSTRTRDSGVFQQAQESVEAWFEQAASPYERAFARSTAGLASYSGDDIADAIDMAEQAIQLIEAFDRTGISDDEQTRWDRLANSVYTSLAYYHADRIGSHDGALARSEQLALQYLASSVRFRERLGLLPRGLDSDDAEIDAALADQALGLTAFQTLDNEAFVRIQTATSEEQIRSIRSRLEFLHKERRPEWSPTAALLYDYHDYCARTMLADLEAN